MTKLRTSEYLALVERLIELAESKELSTEDRRVVYRAKNWVREKRETTGQLTPNNVNPQGRYRNGSGMTI